jgi:hypothetical protein
MLRRIALFSLTALLTLFTAGAQQQPSPEPPKQQAVASEASQALTFGQSLRKTIGFLTADVRKDGAIWKSDPTDVCEVKPAQPCRWHGIRGG